MPTFRCTEFTSFGSTNRVTLLPQVFTPGFNREKYNQHPSAPNSNRQTGYQQQEWNLYEHNSTHWQETVNMFQKIEEISTDI